MRFRPATLSDTFALIELFHRAFTTSKGTNFSEFTAIEKSLSDPDTRDVIIEVGGIVRGLISARFDNDQGICKLNRLIVSPEIEDGKTALKLALEYFLDTVKQEMPHIDVVYTTTTSISRDEQEVTVECGFQVYGVFPNLLGLDASQLNGLTAFFLRDDWKKKRSSRITIHPVIEPFYKIVQKEAGLPELAPEQIASAPEQELSSNEAPSDLTLEIIEAEGFVAKRFKNHIARKSQMIHFYPFYEPNAVITDPEQSCEIFVKIVEHARFAAIIGEHLSIPVKPVELYTKVQALLKERGVGYIEIINDAGDVEGTESIIQSGFTPCAYFPAFKRQGASRRDFVVYGKSFEYLCRPDFQAPRTYLDFYREYFRIEGKNYFPELQS